MKRLVPKTCLLMVVDVQDKLVPAMPVPTMGRLVKNTVLLLDAAWRLKVRTIASEQYPKGLGATMPELATAFAAMNVIPMAKMHFDALSDDAIHKAAFTMRPEAAIIVGMEAHVCVFQTARSFAERGVTTYVVSDAVASRTEENRLSGLHLAERAGAIVTNAETVVFDWLEQAGGDEFKALSKLLR